MPVNLSSEPAIYVSTIGGNNTNLASLFTINTSFISLTDTFTSYSGRGAQFIRVRTNETGLYSVTLTATMVAFDPTGTSLVSTEVQSAIEELDSNSGTLAGRVTSLEEWQDDVDASGSGLLVKIADDPTTPRYARRSLASGNANIVVSNANGVSGNPTVTMALSPTLTNLTLTNNLTVGGTTITLSTFIGGGTRLLQVNNAGVVSATSYPSLTSTYIGYGSVGNITTGNSAFIYDDALFKMEVGFGLSKFLSIDVGTGVYKLGDMSAALNQTYISINDNAQILSFYNQGIANGLSVDYTNSEYRYGNLNNYHYLRFDTVGTGSLYSYGVLQLSVSNVTGVQEFGDVGWDWYRDRLSIDGSARTIKLMSGNQSYLSIDNSTNKMYSFGDIDGAFQSTRLVLDDNTKMATINATTTQLDHIENLTTGNVVVTPDVGAAGYNGSWTGGDMGGTLTLTTPNPSVVTGALLGISFGVPYNSVPTSIVFVPQDQASLVDSLTAQYYITNITATGFIFNCVAAPSPSATLNFSFIIVS